jgi:integrase/recombinase XerD
LEVCEIPRDKAMFSSGFYDAGLRVSELISLNVRNVGFDKLGGYFILPKKGKDLKTGMRKIRLFIMPSSTKYLKDFLNNHPFKNYEDAPLFYSREFSRYNKIKDKIINKEIKKADWEIIRLSRPGIENKLKKVCKLAGLSVLTPHMLRHNSCTQAAKKGFNEMEMRIRYGWSPTSKMPSRYTHLASKDLDDKIKVITGFKEPGEPEKSKLITIICWNCQEENVPTNKFCGKCSANLNPTKEEMTVTATETGLGIQQMMKDPEFMMKMMNMMAEQWKKLEKEKNK